MCIFFRADVVALFRLPTFFYICVANHSVVSKPHSTEVTEIYAGYGFPGWCKVCCAVCTPLGAGRCAPCMCCSLFLRCRHFAFSSGHDLFLRNIQNAYEHIHPPHTTLPRKNLGGERFAVLYTYTLSSSPPLPEHVWRQFSHHLALFFTLTPTTTTTEVRDGMS